MMHLLLTTTSSLAVFWKVWWWLATLAFMGGLGCGFWILIQELTGGRWMKPLRSWMGKAGLLLPLAMILFIPLFAFSDSIYWLSPATPGMAELADKRQGAMNLPFFLLRCLLYASVFLYVAFHGASRAGRKLPPGPVLVFLGLASLFFSVDFIMSREPEWWSSAFPYTVMVTSALLALSLATIFGAGRSGPVKKSQLNSIGNLLLANLVLFLYFLLMELIITYAGDLPPKRLLYMERLSISALGPLLLGILFGAAPAFFGLLVSSLKQNSKLLKLTACCTTLFVLTWTWWFYNPLK